MISIEAEKAFTNIPHTSRIKLSANQEQKECSQLDKEHQFKKTFMPNIILDSAKLLAFEQRSGAK